MQPTCPACSTHGTHNLCPRFACIVRCRPEQGLILLNAGQGISGRGGGLSEYVVVDQMLDHVLPPGTSCEREPRIVRSFLIAFPVEVGAMMEPLAVGWHAVKKANFKAGDSALVLGAGPVGTVYVPTIVCI